MKILVMLFFCFFSVASHAQIKPKMTYMGAYDSGQANVSIHKLFDPTEDVVCYLLMPDQAGRKEGVNGGWVYDGNSIGSMSCVKTKMLVVPIGGSSPQPTTAVKGKK